MSAADRAPSLRNSIRFGGWLAMPERLVIEAAVRAGFDWLGLDMQTRAADQMPIDWVIDLKSQREEDHGQQSGMAF
jgi:2-keto-3-deoxy-L-rhamnonate aldolase RhmA